LEQPSAKSPTSNRFGEHGIKTPRAKIGMQLLPQNKGESMTLAQEESQFTIRQPVNLYSGFANGILLV
jgi:hypothetical protein